MSLISFIPVISQLIDRIIPDKDAQTKAKAELALLESSGELQLMLKQIEVNANEAKHPSVFVAGWRPFIGWVCGLALTWEFILQPILIHIYAVNGLIISMPSFDTAGLITVLTGMLGLGGLRTYEKLKNADTKDLRK